MMQDPVELALLLGVDPVEVALLPGVDPVEVAGLQVARVAGHRR